jgi:hypothetical protein
MNKYLLNKIIGFAVLILCITSCKKNNVVIDQDVVPPSYARFNTRLLSDSIATYYIKSTNDPFKLPIGVTTVSDQDRTIHFSYTSSSAVAGVQYNAPASITIPAGKTVDSLVFSGIFAGYPLSTRIDTVKITITQDGDIPGSPYITPRKDTYKLVLRKYCNVVINDFLGDYANSTDRQGTGTPTGAYTATISSITSTGPSTATAIIYNFGDPMFGAPYNPGDLAITPGITVYLDWSNPAAFKVTLPAAGQAIAVSWYGPTGLVKPATGGLTGTFSSCDQTFTILYSFAIGSTSYGNFTTVLRR